jgi:hypothetical protein
MHYAILLAGLLLAGLPSAADAQSGPCLTDTPKATFLVQRIREVIKNANSVGKVDSVYMPVVPDTAVAIVADSAVCANAVTAYTAATPANDTASASTAVYVVRVSNARYAVWDPHQFLGEYAWFRVFDQSFAYKGDVPI